jgi:hypothetical protein
MAFQAAPHVDRGLEGRHLGPAHRSREHTEKPQGKNDDPDGEDVRTFPAVSGSSIAHFQHGTRTPTFANRTGNAVIAKPHPAAILPLAITVRSREALAEARIDPGMRCRDEAGDIAQLIMALRIDFNAVRWPLAGGTCTQGRSTRKRRASYHHDGAVSLGRNIAFSLAYTGQMCTARNI